MHHFLDHQTISIVFKLSYPLIDIDPLSPSYAIAGYYPPKQSHIFLRTLRTEPSRPTDLCSRYTIGHCENQEYYTLDRYLVYLTKEPSLVAGQDWKIAVSMSTRTCNQYSMLDDDTLPGKTRITTPSKTVWNCCEKDLAVSKIAFTCSSSTVPMLAVFH